MREMIWSRGRVLAVLLLFLALFSGARGQGPVCPQQTHRFGVGMHPDFGVITDYDVASLHVAWYSDWRASLEPLRPGGIEYAQLIWVQDGRFSPSLDQLGPRLTPIQGLCG